MALFHADFLSLVCSSVQVEKEWWIATFEAKEAAVPADWDCPLPSDVALKLPGSDQPNILLSDRAEVERAGYDRRNDHPMMFCTNVKKAHDYLTRRIGVAGPIHDGDGTWYFEVRDPEGNSIEICKEP